MKPLFVPIFRLADHGKLALVIAVASLVAFGSALSIREGNRLKSHDELSFVDVAKNIALHFKFAHTNDPGDDRYDPSIPAGGPKPTAYPPPGFSLFMAPFLHLGAGFVELRIINFLVAGLTLVLLYFLLARYSRLSGLLGIVFVLGYPVLMYLASALYPQTLAACLLVANLYLLDRMGPDSKLRDYALAGLLFATLPLTAPVYLALLPIVLWWLLFRRRSSFRQVAVMAVVTGLTIGIWTIRNYRVFHAFVPLSTNVGHMLISGNSPNSRPWSYAAYAPDRGERDPAGVVIPNYVFTELTGTNEVEANRVLTRGALKLIRENPAQSLIRYVHKFFYWFHYRNDLISDRVIPGGASDVPKRARDLIMLFTYGPLLGLLLVRLALFRRYSISNLELLFVALYIGAGLAHAIFLARIRFRLPFDWLLIALDATFVAQVLSNWASRIARDRLGNAA